MKRKENMVDLLHQFKWMIVLIILISMGNAFILIQSIEKFYLIHEESFEKVIATEELSVEILNIQYELTNALKTPKSVEIKINQEVVKESDDELTNYLNQLLIGSSDVDLVKEIIQMHHEWLGIRGDIFQHGNQSKQLQVGLLILSKMNVKTGILEEKQYEQSNRYYHETLTNIKQKGNFILIFSFLFSGIMIYYFKNMKQRNTDILQEIKDSHILYSNSIENMPDPVILIDDENGKILDANKASEVQYGYSIDELKNMRNVDLSAESKLTVEATKSEINSMPMRWHKNKMGVIFPVEIQASRFEFKGRKVHIAWIHDLTKRLQRETELEKSKKIAQSSELSKTLFFDNISHEIRTPMNGIMGVLQLLERKITEKENQNLIALAIESCEEMLALLDNIIMYSGNIESMHNVEINTFSPIKEVYSIQRLFEPICKMKGITFTIDTPLGDNQLYRGNLLKFRQIILNVISNALKFTSVGGVVVKIDMPIGNDHENSTLHLLVEDTGNGISASDLEKINSGEMMIGNLLTKEQRGIGIGLLLVKRLVSEMEGSLEIEAEVKRGTRVIINLPINYNLKDIEIIE